MARGIRTYRAAVAASLLLSALALGAQSAAPPLNSKLVKRYAQLNAQAARQNGPKRAETLAKLAALDYSFADSSYSAHQPQTASQHLAQATAHADQACAILHAEAALGKKDRIKNVERIIQSIAFALRGLEQSVSYQQQPQVQAAVEHFTNLNYELLQWLFAPKH
ncbi:MAG: hypothetical protein ACRD1C_05430 [Terriglobales bacterium]